MYIYMYVYGSCPVWKIRTYFHGSKNALIFFEPGDNRMGGNQSNCRVHALWKGQGRPAVDVGPEIPENWNLNLYVMPPNFSVLAIKSN